MFHSELGTEECDAPDQGPQDRSWRSKPVPDETSAPFWDALRCGKLCVQHCRYCDSFQHPPRERCGTCDSAGDRLEFAPVSGLGTVRTSSVMHTSFVAAFDDLAPWTVFVVELDEQPGLFLLGGASGGRSEFAYGDRVSLQARHDALWPVSVAAAPGRSTGGEW